MNTSPFKAVFFDFNGIIVDDEPLHLRLFQEVCKEEGVLLTQRDYYARYLGYDDKGCFSAVFRDAGRPIDREKIDDLIQRKAAKYEKNIKNNMRIFPGVIELVKGWQKGPLLGIVSGALRQEILSVCEAAGIRQAFQVVVSAEDTRFGKPHPEGYLKGWERLLEREGLSEADLPRNACLVIEDSLAGIESAHGAGMTCLAITNSYSAQELRAADWVRESLEGFTFSSLR